MKLIINILTLQLHSSTESGGNTPELFQLERRQHCSPRVKLQYFHYTVHTHAQPHLAGVEHVCHGSSAQVSRGDYVLLATGVPSSHCFGRGQRDAFGHADELLWSGGLWRRVGADEHLEGL